MKTLVSIRVSSWVDRNSNQLLWVWFALIDSILPGCAVFPVTPFDAGLADLSGADAAAGFALATTLGPSAESLQPAMIEKVQRIIVAKNRRIIVVLRVEGSSWGESWNSSIRWAVTENPN